MLVTSPSLPICHGTDLTIDVKSLTPDGPDIIPSLEPAFQKYNESQLVTVKLPGGSQEVIVSEFNRANGGSRYYDVGSQTSFAFDHISRVCLECLVVLQLVLTSCVIRNHRPYSRLLWNRRMRI